MKHARESESNAALIERLGVDWPPARTVSAIRRALLAWYARHARKLPWRCEPPDPYAVWVSEAMLQQTQVATVVGYYERFMERFPTISDLAAAREADVLQLWQGLGYYRRARALHAAAREIVQRWSGTFPASTTALESLPGVGRYTAAAIASIAFDQRVGLVEANTQRVLSRLLAYAEDPRTREAQQVLWALADMLVAPRTPGRFNQALMELGALICTPRQPLCPQCPLQRCCPTFAAGLQDHIPARARAATTTQLEHTALVLCRSGRLLLLQRQPGQWWEGLWDFPRFDGRVVASGDRLETQSEGVWRTICEALHRQLGLAATWRRQLPTLRHGVTRYRITLYCHEARVEAGRLKTGAAGRWYRPAELTDLALTAPARRIAQRHLRARSEG